MKNLIGIISLILVSLVLVFTACKKDGDQKLKDDYTFEINLKSFEPDITVKGGGENGRYEKLIIEELVKNPDCKYEIVSGIIEFYLEDEMVFSVHFGNGSCDGIATITWVKDNGSTQSKEVDVWRLFKKHNGENGEDKDKCFILILPVDFQMPDGSTLTVAEREDWRALKAWYHENPGYEELPEMQYPVEIKFRAGEIVTVTNEREMARYKEGCEDLKPRFHKVITEELIRSEDCNGEIVSGLIDFYNNERVWVYSIDFGNGDCDGIATKCWINKETLEQECEDFDIRDWKPRS